MVEIGVATICEVKEMLEEGFQTLGNKVDTISRYTSGALLSLPARGNRLHVPIVTL